MKIFDRNFISSFLRFRCYVAAILIICVDILSFSAHLTLNNKPINSFSISGRINTSKGYVKLLPIDFFSNHQVSMKMPTYKGKIVNGAFKINGIILNTYFFKLEYYNGDSLKFKSNYFVIEPGLQKASFNVNNEAYSINNKTMNDYYKSKSFKKYSRLKKDYQWLATYSDSLTSANKKGLPNNLKDELKSLEKIYKERNHMLLVDLCLELPNSYYSLWKLFDEFNQNGFKDDYDALFTGLSDSIKQSAEGYKVKKILDESNIIGNGKKLPNHIYEDVKNNRSDSLELKHEYTFIQFWNTGCGTCIASIPKMQDLYKEYHKNGFNIISICYDKKDRIPILNRILNRFQPSWNEYFDESATNCKSLGITYPRYVMIDSSGIIVDNRSSIDKIKKFLASKYQ